MTDKIRPPAVEHVTWLDRYANGQGLGPLLTLEMVEALKAIGYVDDIGSVTDKGYAELRRYRGVMTPHGRYIPWNLDLGLRIIRSLELTARRCGYQLSLAGSVLWTGGGRDLDIIATRVIPHADVTPALLVSTLCGFLQAKLLTDGVSAFREAVSDALIEYEGRLIDLQIICPRLEDLDSYLARRRDAPRNYGKEEAL